MPTSKMENAHIAKLRVHNLKRLIRLETSNKAFAEKAQLDKAQLSRYLNKPDQYPISNEMANRIEARLNKPSGWLSAEHPADSSRMNVDLCATATIEFISILESYNIDIHELDKSMCFKMISASLNKVAQCEGIDREAMKDAIFVANINAFTEKSN